MANPITTAEDFSERRFDFVIIGGGTAGLVVAYRLSERSDLKIGILEAGPDAQGNEQVDIPGLFGSTIGSDLDWRMETIPQPGLSGRRIPWTRGKVLGGTSALNFLGWNRASRHDYDAWAELGCTGWGWDDLLPYFKKSETFHPPSQDTQTRHRTDYDIDSLGNSGPIHISYGAEFSASHQYWHDTWANLGVPPNKAHLMGSNLGAYTKVASVDPADQTRSYSASAYYQPIRHRPNLAVLTGAFVERIVLKQLQGEESWRATGVQFTHQDSNDKSYFVSATNEVILCAGSTQSPQILELSGIGHPGILAKAGVEIKVASPMVGENLQDHIMALSVYEVDPNLSTKDDLKGDAAALQAAKETYAASRSGPLTVISNAMCYLSLGQVMQQEKLDDISKRARALNALDDGDLRDKTRQRRFEKKAPKVGQMEYIFDLGNLSSFFKPQSSSDIKKKYGTVLTILQYPFSRGSIHIESANPRDHPVIDPRFYQGPGGEVDLDVMVESVKFAEKFTQTKPLTNIIRGRVVPPAGEDSDIALRDWLRRDSTTDWHPIGTCSMGGRRGIAGGVVDERLRVYGVEGLRVIDASVMPLQISAHPQATIYAIAEKGAQMILEDQGV